MEADDAGSDGSTWTQVSGATLAGADSKFVRLATLLDKKVLTVGEDPANKNRVVINVASANSALASLESGVYLIQLQTKDERNGSYLVTDLQGIGGGYRLAEKQNFNYIPSAQWVVEKLYNTATSAVRITNREFNDNFITVSQLYKNSDGSYSGVLIPEASKIADKLTFTRVNDVQLKDSTLGYLNTAKYSSEELKVKRFKFDYLSAFNDGIYLSVPATKDSVIDLFLSETTYINTLAIISGTSSHTFTQDSCYAPE